MKMLKMRSDVVMTLLSVISHFKLPEKNNYQRALIEQICQHIFGKRVKTSYLVAQEDSAKYSKLW